MKTTRTRDELIATCRTLARSLANEALTEAEAEAIRRQMRDVQAEIQVAEEADIAHAYSDGYMTGLHWKYSYNPGGPYYDRSTGADPVKSGYACHKSWHDGFLAGRGVAGEARP